METLSNQLFVSEWFIHELCSHFNDLVFYLNLSRVNKALYKYLESRLELFIERCIFKTVDKENEKFKMVLLDDKLYIHGPSYLNGFRFDWFFDELLDLSEYTGEAKLSLIDEDSYLLLCTLYLNNDRNTKLAAFNFAHNNADFVCYLAINHELSLYIIRNGRHYHSCSASILHDYNNLLDDNLTEEILRYILAFSDCLNINI